jgi:alpha-amylase
MESVCFYFQVHQPFRLKRYSFFDIGGDDEYFDQYSNKTILKKVAEKCYIPTNNLFLELIKRYGKEFKISYSLSGVFIDQLEKYAPQVLDSFIELAETGNVEFLSETFSHSLAALKSQKEFEHQVGLHKEKIKKYFKQTPTVFRNNELIYSDRIGDMVQNMGYKGMITEGAKQILGWKSPNFVYANAVNPKLKLLLKNYTLSDDIAFRFSNRDWNEWPLTTEKYVDWLNSAKTSQDSVINLFMDYETFGEHQWADSGIFKFMEALPERLLNHSSYKFLKPSEVLKKYDVVSPLSIPNEISWADEERDLTAWLGNDLQYDAFDKLYALEEQVYKKGDEKLLKDWLYLQTSDHFYYMCTKWFSDGDVHKYFNPYDTPYVAYINYMNVLSDFMIRLNK